MYTRDELILIDDVAALLKTTPRVVRKHLYQRDGRVPEPCSGPRQRLTWRSSDVQRFIAGLSRTEVAHG